MTAVRETRAMIAGMKPALQPGIWSFHTFADARDAAPFMDKALAVFREQEGISLILPAAPTAQLPMRCITLQVHSALDGIGLTAAVAESLTTVGIPCNVVAAYHHDHVFVPADMADKALNALHALSATHSDKSGTFPLSEAD